MNQKLTERLRKWTDSVVSPAKPPPAAPAAPVPLAAATADHGLHAPSADAGNGAAAAESPWRDTVYQKVLQQLDLAMVGRLPELAAREEIRDAALWVMNQETMPLPAVERQRIASQVENEIMGLGPIEPLIADRAVSDILVNGYDQVYVERRGKLELTDVRFRDDAHVMTIIDRIVGRVGRRIDESSPMVDARLADGSRVNAIIPPLAIDGPLLSIRRFTIGRLRMEELIDLGTLSPIMAEMFSAMVRGRLNVLISGGTGSGKTTLLNVLSGFIPVTERIISIEDSAELQLQQPHVCRLETRPPNVENRGEVTQRDLVRNALRMRPDRIIVGEVRGGEAFDMLQAMNTGHDGSLTTVHANSPRDALARVENMIAMAAMGLPTQTAREQIASALNVVIQIERMEDGRRRIVSVQEIEGMESGTVTMAELYRFVRKGVDQSGGVLGQFESTGLVPLFHSRLRARGIELRPEWFEPRPHPMPRSKS